MEIETRKEKEPQITYQAKSADVIKDFIDSMLIEILKEMKKPLKSPELWTNVFFGDNHIDIGVDVFEGGWSILEFSSRGRMVKTRNYGLKKVCELHIKVVKYNLPLSQIAVISFAVAYEPCYHKRSSQIILAINDGFRHRYHLTHNLNNYYIKTKSPTNKWS